MKHRWYRSFLATVVPSLLLAVVLAICWVRSYASPAHLGDFGGGYVLRSYQGKLTLGRPPDPGPRAAGASALASWMSNEDVLWEARGSQTARGVNYSVIPTIRPGTGTWAFGAEFGGSPEFARGLLGALDRPDRAVAAHVLLVSYLGPPSPSGSWGRKGDEVTTGYDTLPVRFNAGSLEAAADAEGGASRTLGPNVRPDAANWRALRDLWHDRLDVPLVTVRYSVVLIPTLLLPIAWCSLRGRAARRTAKGLCPACGYDLRATPERCPECGAVPKGTASRTMVAST